MLVLKVHELKKFFGKKEVVKGVNFEVRQGEIFGFLGHNGAGKTTIINMITGIVPSTEGTIELLNEEIKNLDKVKNKIGVMPDASNFYDNLNGYQHLKYYSELIGLKAKKSELLELLNKVGLKGDEYERVGGYSFGMKKKLSLAQAILGKPELIFLDEPTSGVDPESALEIQKLIKGINREGTTVFMTSHNMDEIERMCNRVAIVSKGTIVKYGAIETLKKEQNSNTSVKLKVRNTDIDTTITILENKIQSSLIEVESNFVNFEVESEEKIPDIISLLVRNGIQIFEVVQKDISLEEIFFETGTSNFSFDH